MYRGWTLGAPDEYGKFIPTKYTSLFSLDVLEPAKRLVIRPRSGNGEKEPADLKELFDDMRLELIYWEEGKARTKYDSNGVLYRVEKSQDSVAAECTDRATGHGLEGRRAMTAAEINKLCDVLSGELRDFDDVRYSFRHLVDDVSRLFGAGDARGEYESEKLVRSVLKERIMESLGQIRSKAPEAVA
ncbi:MAG: hypothetical protein V1813_00765 [Candidatus Aenigmatarchaeota archaeon]